MQKKTTSDKKVAIFGATGYVGLMLVNRLVREAVDLTLFVRNKRRLEYLKEFKNFSVCDSEINPEKVDKIAQKLEGVDVVYYLIQANHQALDTDERPGVEIAKTISEAAAKAQVEQIIYLGELGIEKEGRPLSEHLRCRQETGDALRSSGVPVTEVRSGIIIGPGSVGFEIIRALATRLPFMPKMTFNTGRCQPIDIDDVINYLFHVYKHPTFMGQIVEVGMQRDYGCDELVSRFAKQHYGRTLRHLDIPYLDRIITKKVLARLIALLSAIPYELAYPLVDDMDSFSIKGDHAYESYDTSCTLPGTHSDVNSLLGKDTNMMDTLTFEESIKKAFSQEAKGRVESYWSVPLESQVLLREEEEFLFSAHHEQDGLLYEKRERQIAVEDVPSVFEEVKRIGGEHGYWSPQWMWSSRAILDKLMGGPGLDLGRRTYDNAIRVGERLDFWIVSDYQDQPDRKVLTLKGRLKSPGDSWLQFILLPEEEDATRWKFVLRASFLPSGIMGYFYWYSLFFIHKYIFTAMIDKIIDNASKA